MNIDNINKIRSQIDDIDDKIFSLVVKRLQKAKIIGEIKKELKLAVYDKEREGIIINRLIEKLNNQLNEEQIKKIFEPIVDISKDLQQQEK
tara:strand:- start:216 stop:488 length:273 start_codon:yes stop_codon:yes gene_type:complete